MFRISKQMTSGMLASQHASQHAWLRKREKVALSRPLAGTVKKVDQSLKPATSLAVEVRLWEFHRFENFPINSQQMFHDFPILHPTLTSIFHMDLPAMFDCKRPKGRSMVSRSRGF